MLFGASLSLGAQWSELKAVGYKVTGLDRRLESEFTTELSQLEQELR